VSGRVRIEEIQRARILAGMVSVACERGAASVSVTDVVGCCGVSRRTFYELFDGREDCFLAAFEDAVERAAVRVLSAYEGETGWLGRLRAGLLALLRFIDDEPQLGRLLIHESLSASPAVLARRMQIVGQLAGFVDEGRREGKAGEGFSVLQAEGVVGGVLSILQNLLVSDRVGDPQGPCVGLVGPLMRMLVLPYLGPVVARREHDRPVPVEAGSVTTAGFVDPFKYPGMRVTYRTVMVLTLVAENPGSSNRVLGDLAGIGDQGQISKLLGRLRRLGLVDNCEPDLSRGAPNAWVLTDTGRRLTDGIRAHTGSWEQG
jgi:AcrR family transcriptional regulator